MLLPFLTTLPDTTAFSTTGVPKTSLVLVDDSQNAVKLHSLAGLDIQLLDEDDVALGHAVLLTAGNDDSVLQTRCTCLSVESRSCGREEASALYPLNAALTVYHSTTYLSTVFRAKGELFSAHGKNHGAGQRRGFENSETQPQMAFVSRAMTSSSFVGMTNTLTLESGVEIMMSSPRLLLAASSIFTPR